AFFVSSIFPMHTYLKISSTTCGEEPFLSLFGNEQYAWLSLFWSMIFGITEQFRFICLQTILQKNTEPHLLPNVFAVQGVISTITFGMSTLLLNPWC
ncbi:hypothetical protein ABS784_17025, partial [Geobacillus sp. G4]